MPSKIIAANITLLALALCQCGSSENERLRTENDSLRRELETRHSIVAVMHDVKTLIDSIDANRNMLKTDLDEGTTYEDFAVRLKDINDHVKKTQEKISTMEGRLRTSENNADAYLMMVDALKGELAIRAQEVLTLEHQVMEYQKENKNLVQTVGLQDAEITDLQTKIEARQQELSLLEAKVNELVENFKVSEAEAYYSRAKAVEEAARRTKLARHKKYETYREALELYKKALSLGKDEAQENIAALEKKIGDS
jgi:chromosome segregation ATPase